MTRHLTLCKFTVAREKHAGARPYNPSLLIWWRKA
jgi:hypothetical protein